MISVLFLGSICLEGTRKAGVGGKQHIQRRLGSMCVFFFEFFLSVFISN